MLPVCSVRGAISLLCWLGGGGGGGGGGRLAQVLCPPGHAPTVSVTRHFRQDSAMMSNNSIVPGLSLNYESI